MTELFAVPPRIGTVIHLMRPGYRPRGSKRTRSIRDSDGLCGSLVVFPDNHDQITPLTDALGWTAPHKHHDGCACSKRQWRWCRLCVGHAVDDANVVAEALRLVLASTTAESTQ